MAIIHRLGRATVQEVQSELEDPPTNAAVRSILRILVQKGHLVIEQEGTRYVYSPSVPARAAQRSVLENMIRTFFAGSTEGAMAALLETGKPLTAAEKKRLKKLIDEIGEEGR
jgi:predicted transcriptional regulator